MTLLRRWYLFGFTASVARRLRRAQGLVRGSL